MDFIGKQNQSWVDDLDRHIAQNLFEDWAHEQEQKADNEGHDTDLYLEWCLMSYASSDMQTKYNEHYGLTMDDEFYFVSSDKWQEYLDHIGKKAEWAHLEGNK
jgi:hypothetical protein